jgi:hypothetical protein
LPKHIKDPKTSDVYTDMNFIANLSNLLSFLPTIVKAVMDAESVITSPQSGATKKTIVLAAIDIVAKDVEGVDNKLVAQIATWVDAVVSALNTGNVFTHAK